MALSNSDPVLSEKANSSESCELITGYFEDELTIGTKVCSEDEAYDLYNLYALRMGFSIRKGNRRLVNGVIRQREYLCSKAGFHEFEDSYNIKMDNRLETRTGCLAKIRFTVKNGAWEVTHFNEVHNHELASQGERHNLRSGRRILDAHAGIISSMVRAGIKPTDSYLYLAQQIGGVKSVGLIKKDCQKPSELSYKQHKSTRALRLSELNRLGCRVFDRGSLTERGTRIVKEKLREALELLEKELETSDATDNTNTKAISINVESNVANKMQCSNENAQVLDPLPFTKKGLANAQITTQLERTRRKKNKKATQSSKPRGNQKILFSSAQVLQPVPFQMVRPDAFQTPCIGPRPQLPPCSAQNVVNSALLMPHPTSFVVQSKSGDVLDMQEKSSPESMAAEHVQ